MILLPQSPHLARFIFRGSHCVVQNVLEFTIYLTGLGFMVNLLAHPSLGITDRLIWPSLAWNYSEAEAALELSDTSPSTSLHAKLEILRAEGCSRSPSSYPTSWGQIRDLSRQSPHQLNPLALALGWQRLSHPS